MFKYLLSIGALAIVSCHVVNAGKQLCINNTEFDRPQCYCDDQCVQFGDCCYDSYDSNMTHGSSSPLDGVDDLTNATFCMRTLVSPGFSYLSSYGAYVVNKCRNSSIDCFKDADKFESNFPVSDFTGVAYLNAKCAECNGIKDYKYWRLAYKVSYTDSFYSTDFSNFTMEEFAHSVSSKASELSIQYPMFCIIITEPTMDICLSYQNLAICKYKIKSKLFKNKECCLASRDCKNGCDNIVVYHRGIIRFAAKNNTIIRNLGRESLVVVLKMEEAQDIKRKSQVNGNERILSSTFVNSKYIILTNINTEGSEQDIDTFAACIYDVALYWDGTKYKLFVSSQDVFLYKYYPTGCFSKTRGCTTVQLGAFIVSKAFVSIKDKAEIIRLSRNFSFIFPDQSQRKLVGNSSILSVTSVQNTVPTFAERDADLIESEHNYYRSIFSMSSESLECLEVFFVFPLESRKRGQEVKVACTVPEDRTEKSESSRVRPSYVYIMFVMFLLLGISYC